MLTILHFSVFMKNSVSNRQEFMLNFYAKQLSSYRKSKNSIMRNAVIFTIIVLSRNNDALKKKIDIFDIFIGP